MRHDLRLFAFHLVQVQGQGLQLRPGGGGKCRGSPLVQFLLGDESLGVRQPEQVKVVIPQAVPDPLLDDSGYFLPRN